MPLFGPPNVEKLKAKNDVEGLLRASEHRDPEVQKGALDALSSLGAPARERLASGLEASNESKRRSAAAALERLGWEPERDEERVSLFFAAERWARLAEVGQAAEPWLLRALTERNRGDDVRTAAAALLGLVGTARCVDSLADVHAQTPASPLSIAAIGSLGRLGADAVRRLTADLRNERLDENKRIDAGQTLGVIGPDAVDALTSLLVSLDRLDAKQELVWAGAMLALAGSGDRRALPILNSLLERAAGQAREDVELCLRAIASPPDSLLAALSDSQNPGARMIAALALGHTREEAGVPGLVRMLNDYPALMAVAMDALGKIGGATAVAALDTQLQHREAVVRLRAILALLDVEDTSARASIARAVEDRDLAVRAVAGYGLGPPGRTDVQA